MNDEVGIITHFAIDENGMLYVKHTEEIIYCANCRHFEHGSFCDEHCYEVKEDDYCVWGERE